MLGVDVLAAHIGAAKNADVAATHGFHTHIADLIAFLQGDEVQRVGVGACQIFIGENDFGGQGSQHFPQHPVGAVANAGLAQRTVEDHPESIRIGMLFPEDSGGAGGAHGVGRRRAYADFVYISDGFHRKFLRYVVFHHIISNSSKNYNGESDKILGDPACQFAKNAIQVLDKCVKI